MYCYLIQPVELVGTNRYKIGMSALSNLSRMKSYKNGTRYLCILECVDALAVERQLIKAFNDRYKLIGGNEYFQIDCPELEMLNLFLDIVVRHKTAEKKSAELDWNRFAFKKAVNTC